MDASEANEKAQAAIRRVCQWRDETDQSAIGEFTTRDIEETYSEAVAYAFGQGPKPYWWDKSVSQ